MSLPVARKPVGRKAVGSSPNAHVQPASQSSAAPSQNAPTQVAVDPSEHYPRPVSMISATPAVPSNVVPYWGVTSPMPATVSYSTPQLPGPSPWAATGPIGQYQVPAPVQFPTYQAPPAQITDPRSSMSFPGHVPVPNPIPVAAPIPTYNHPAAVLQPNSGYTTATPVFRPAPTPLQTVQPMPTVQPVQTPAPGQLHRVMTTGSIQSLPSTFSRQPSVSSSVGIATPMTAITTPGSPFSPVMSPGVFTAATPQAPVAVGGLVYSVTCVSCKKGIAPNISVYSCLVCSTAHASTLFCVWCYTTGAAANSHPHTSTYWGTDSDLRVPGPTGNIPSELWTVRMNAHGKLWFTHNQTGFKTHVRPMTTVDDASGLPAGWAEMKTPDGKLYYLHQTTGTTSWTKPTASLPSGWRMVKTPDAVPFYVHEDLQLSTWDRPGEQPKPRAATAAANAAGQENTVGTDGKKIKTAVKVAGTAAAIATAADVAVNVAKLGAAADLTPSGIITATVAAAKLTSIGVKAASKKMGKFSKSKRLSTAGNMLSAASSISRLTGDDDGGDASGDNGQGDFDSADYAADTGSTTEDAVVYPPQNTFLDPQDASSLYDQQSLAYAPPQPIPEDQPYYYPQQQFYPTDPSQFNFPAQPVPQEVTTPPPPSPPPQPVIINNINVTVDETDITNNTDVQNIDLTQNNQFNLQQDAIINNDVALTNNSPVAVTAQPPVS